MRLANEAAAMVPGDMLTRDVRLIEMLACGGMGRVWRAEHLGRGHEVAVKFLAPHLAHDHGMLARFEREASAAARIRSAHVVRVFERGARADGTPYLVMELLHGEDLGARIDRLG